MVTWSPAPGVGWCVCGHVPGRYLPAVGLIQGLHVGQRYLCGFFTALHARVAKYLAFHTNNFSTIVNIHLKKISVM